MAKPFERGIISDKDFRKPVVIICYGLMCVMLILLAASMVYPFLTIVFNALKTRGDIYSFPPSLLPKEAWLWSNFKTGWLFESFGRYTWNTFVIYAGKMFFAMLLIGMSAFALAHMKVPFRKGFTLFFMCTLLIPQATYIIPNYLNLKELQLLNSYWAFWLPAAANGFWILLLKGFFEGIHKELFEAARMDGASEFLCFARIAMPLSVPILATLCIFGFTETWNEWFWPSLVLSSPENYPIATAVYKYVLSGETNNIQVNIRFAILAIILVPPLVIFMLLQKHIIRGVNLSGIKG